MSRTLDEIRPGYRFNESCQNTVPQAIVAFLESTDFEDAIRNAISLGGDSDTLVAITGSIAETTYGVPQELKDKAWEYVYAKLGADEVEAQEAEFDLTNSTGWLKDAKLFLAGPHMYFKSNEIYKKGESRYSLNPSTKASTQNVC